MQRCFQLALLGKKDAKPNPLVGAVLVHNGTIIGEGWHEIYGEAHAEVNCIQSVSDLNRHLIADSTLYVSLEPCIHFGKTPPCADLIIQSGIKRVVIACSDPFEEVKGGGIKKLRDAGIEVITPFLEHEALVLNKRFFTFHTRQRPYIILKWAQSKDKKISSTGKRYKISNILTDALVHKWRSEEGAILIGTNTALVDNPSLTTRHWPGKSPLRLVIDMALKIPIDSILYTDEEPVVIFNASKDEKVGKKMFYKCSADNLLRDILGYVYTNNITSLIVEGGTKLLQSFIEAGLWDEARIITNNNLQIGDGVKAPTLYDEQPEASYSILSDQFVISRNPATSAVKPT